MRGDILIVGAGPVGLSTALGLSSLGYKITLIDQRDKPSQTILQQDQRMIALSHRSIQFLKSLGVWSNVESSGTPIDHVHVSQKGNRLYTMINADECGVDHLGYLVPQGILVLEMFDALSTKENIDYLEKTTLVPSVHIARGCAILKMEHAQKELQFDWIMAADGVDSIVRNSLGMETLHNDYSQAAVIAKCRFERPHHNTAYERFTEEGPLALLPLNTHEMAVVLTVPRDRIAFWEEASDEACSKSIMERLQINLGEILEVSERQIWPLTLMLPKTLHQGKVMLIGNSAHGIHPIAGQGLNLGFRDSELLIALFSKGDFNEKRLAQFFRARHKDIVSTVGATDFLVNAFGVKGEVAQTLRTVGLAAVKYCPILKRKIAMSGMGYIK